jgi:hypothetical protein
MDIRIGIVNAAGEVKLEMSDDTSIDDVKAMVDAAVSNGGGLVWLTDKKGRQTGFPAERLAYIELGIPNDDQRIGFS